MVVIEFNQGRPRKKGGTVMDPELSNTNEKKTFEHLGLLANEVIKVRETLQKVSSRESDLKGLLGELADCLENLTNRVSRLESIVREASQSAVAEAQRDQEIQESLEAEKAAVEAQLQEREEILQARETCIKQLEGNLAANIQDLERRIMEQEKLMEIRDSALKDLKSAMGALGALAEELSSRDGGRVVVLQETEEQQNEKASAEIKEEEIEDAKERMGTEIEKLRAEIREKDTMLTAKGVEVEIIKQKAGSRIRELEEQLRNKSGRKRARFISFLPHGGERG